MTRRLFGSSHTTESAFVKWIPTHCHNDVRLLTLPFCLSDTRHESKNSGTMYNRCNDTTLLPTNRHFDGQRVTVQIGDSQSNNPNTRHTDTPRIDETCPNNWHTRRDSRLPKNFAQNINGRETINVAQRRPNRSHELQHKRERDWAVNLQQCFTDAFRTIYWTSSLD